MWVTYSRFSKCLEIGTYGSRKHWYNITKLMAMEIAKENNVSKFFKIIK
jgi:hypothetical protein